MPNKYQSFPNETAARNASRNAMGKNRSKLDTDVTEYLWEVYEGEDGQWHMVVLDSPNTNSRRDNAHTPSELSAMSDTRPNKKDEVLN